MAVVGDGWHKKFLYSVTAGTGDVGKGREFCGVANSKKAHCRKSKTKKENKAKQNELQKH